MKIEFRDLAFGYKSHMVFSGVNDTLENVRFCCLIGPNGAGKSTLLKCINGSHKPSAGAVLLDGRDVQSISLIERARLFGYVPQFTRTDPCLNVLETVISGRMPKMSGKAGKADVEAAEKILVELHLEAFALRPMSQLSGGERQRILIARAIAQEPKFMLLDEPTSNLDLHYQLETMELMEKTARERGIGVIAVIHDLSAVLRFADEVLLLDKGGIVGHGSPHEVINEQSLADSFEVRSAFTEAGGVPVMVPLESVNRV